MKAWQALAWMSLAAGSAAAEEQTDLFLSTRAAGRGGTGVAAAEGIEAARLNAATLAESKARFQIRPLQLDGVIGENALDTISDLTKLTEVSDGLGFLRSFDDKFGKRQYLRGQGSVLALRFGAFEFQNFASVDSWLELRQPALIEASFKADTFFGYQMSYAHQLGAKWQVGATVRSITRNYIAGAMSFTDVIEFAPPSTVEFEDYAPLKKGSGYGADLAVLWRPTVPLRIGLTLENVGDTAFNGGEDSPPSLLQKIDIGAMYRIKAGSWNLDLHADWTDLWQRQNQHLSRALQLGAEFGRPLFTKDHDIGLLGGIHEGYLSGGFFADLWLFRLDISNYAVELGEVPGQRIDRRWAFSLSTSASF